jgi:hypothetical protein
VAECTHIVKAEREEATTAILLQDVELAQEEAFVLWLHAEVTQNLSILLDEEITIAVNELSRDGFETLELLNHILDLLGSAKRYVGLTPNFACDLGEATNVGLAENFSDIHNLTTI